jgi:hypothetical protein
MSKTFLEITPGSTGDWLITITDAAGAPKSLDTLTSAWFTVLARWADPDPGIFQLALGSGLTVADSAAGTLRVLASPAQTTLLASLRKAVWDCRTKFADGTVSNPEGLSGELIIKPRGTKAN